MDSEEVEHAIDEESQDSEINIIPVQLVDSYEGVSLSPTNSSNIVRGKYYKQTYRPAWEEMPDFKGWLRGVEGEPTRAYCTYCQKTLHAHRLSLLKHTCTLRHQKAAQIYNARKFNFQNKDHAAMEQEIQTVLLRNDGVINHEDIEGDSETIVEYAEANLEEPEEHEEQEEDDEESVPLEVQHIQFQKIGNLQKPPISTQVLDTTLGVPVSGLQVSLYKLIDGRWTYINEGVTNSAGRFSQFLERTDFTPGRYKLHYDVDRYFESRKQVSLYPFIEIVFDSAMYSDHYHIPMLLSPFGYTTYRGS